LLKPTIAFACGRYPGVNRTGGDDDPALIDEIAA